MGKREAEVKITGNTQDAKASFSDLKGFARKSFQEMSEDAKKESQEVTDAFQKSGIRMEKDIKKSSDDARKRYKKIKDSGTSSANDIKRAHISMTRTIKRNNKELSVSQNLVSKGFKIMRTNILAVTLAATGMALTIKKAFDFAESGAKIRAQRVAFTNFANSLGRDGDAIIAKLQEVSKGTVSAAELVESAGSALLLGLDPGKIVQLLEIARASSKLTGEAITDQFFDIAKGTGRASKLILDNLGIQFAQGEANKRMAASLGITVAKLTDAEIKQGNLNEVIRQGIPIIQGVGKDYISQADVLAQLTVKVKDYMDKLAVLSLKAIPIVQTAFLKLRKAQLLLQRQLFETLPLIAKFTDFIGLTKTASAATTDAIDQLNKEIGDLDTAISDVAKSTAELEANENSLSKSSQQVAKDLAERIRLREEEVQAAQESQKVLFNALLSAESQQKATNEAIKNTIKETRKELQGLQREAERARAFSVSVAEEIERSSRVQEQKGLDPIEKLLSDLEFAEEDFKRASEERAAGNIEAARKLTLSAVQAASSILETQKTDIAGTDVSTFELEKAQRAAKKLQESAGDFAAEMEKAAQDAIPAVQQEIESLDNQLKIGEATLIGIKSALKDDVALAQELKDKLREDTMATHTQIIQKIEGKSTGGEVGVPGFNRGGPVPGGYGGGDKIRALLEPGEHVIRKESVAKIGRAAAVAFNAGDVAGLINSLPVQQKFKEGGEVGDTANVNLILDNKAFPVKAEKSVADEFVQEIKDINLVRSRRKNVY
jgi:hypothetical protein